MVRTHWFCRCTAQHRILEVGWKRGWESYQFLMSRSHWGGSMWWWWWWTGSLPQWQWLCRWGYRTGQQWRDQLERWLRHQLWLLALQANESESSKSKKKHSENLRMITQNIVSRSTICMTTSFLWMSIISISNYNLLAVMPTVAWVL